MSVAEDEREKRQYALKKAELLLKLKQLDEQIATRSSSTGDNEDKQKSSANSERKEKMKEPQMDPFDHELKFQREKLEDSRRQRDGL